MSGKKRGASLLGQCDCGLGKVGRCLPSSARQKEREPGFSADLDLGRSTLTSQGMLSDPSVMSDSCDSLNTTVL